MIKNFTLSLFILLFLTGCGFKVTTVQKLSTYFISEINTTGDNRINYTLKNKLLQNEKDINKIPVNVSIKTTKNKSIKEKNIKNEITKYNINININVNISSIDKGILGAFVLKENGSFDVNTQYSETMNSEKKLIRKLSDNLADQIQNKIIFILNNK